MSTNNSSTIDVLTKALFEARAMLSTVSPKEPDREETWKRGLATIDSALEMARRP